MLSRFPPEVLANITAHLPGLVLRDLWLTGDALLRQKLRKGGITRLQLPTVPVQNSSFPWPRKLISALDSLLEITTERLRTWDYYRVTDLDLLTLPKKMTRLELSFKEFPADSARPLAELFPNLEVLALHSSHDFPTEQLIPWPPHLRSLSLEKRGDWKDLLKQLEPISQQLNRLTIRGNLKMKSDERLRFPNLTFLDLHVTAHTSKVLTGLPMTLTTLWLDITPDSRAIDEGSLFWDLLPSTITKVDVYTIATMVVIVERPKPQQLERLTSLRSLHLDINYSESEESDDSTEADRPNGVMAFWKACPTLESLSMTYLVTYVSDANVAYLPPFYKNAITTSNQLARKRSKPMTKGAKQRTTRFSAPSLALLPQTLRGLTLRAYYTKEELEGATLPSGLSTFNWHGHEEGAQFCPISFLAGPKLTSLSLGSCYLELSGSDTLPVTLPPSLETLMMHACFLPTQSTLQFPPSLRTLNVSYQPHNGVIPNPPLWNYSNPDIIPRTLTSLTIRSYKQALSRKFVSWIAKIPYREFSALRTLSIDTWDWRDAPPTFEYPDLEQKKIGREALKQVAELHNLESLTLLVQHFRPRHVKNLPASLEMLSFVCYDGSMERVTAEHINYFPKSLKRFSFLGTSPQVDRSAWAQNGYPTPNYSPMIKPKTSKGLKK